MRGFRAIRFKLSVVSAIVNTHIKSVYDKPAEFSNFISNPPCRTILDTGFSVPFCSVPSSNFESPDTRKTEILGIADKDNDNDNDVVDEDYEDDSEEDSVEKFVKEHDECFLKDVKTVLDILKNGETSRVEMKNKLEQCDVKPTSELVSEVLSRVRNDWETAFTFFLWAGKQPGYVRSLREFNSMISILGKTRKFDTAWALIDEVKKKNPSLVTSQTLLIMIRRYCAVHDVGRAINTFYAYKKYKFDLGIEEFQSLLSALCRYKNVEDAQHLLFCNREAYPFDTKSFNIILNGWCNVIGSPREAERVWWEMGKRSIRYDVVSYSSMMSCYSKTGNLNKVLRLFSQMKKMGIEPDRKVYNAVIHALAKCRFVKEAMNLMKTMEEKAIPPNVVTYNSLIKPLCRAKNTDEATAVFNEMLQRGISPTIRTYHAFFRILRTGEETFELLEKMREKGCQPTIETYIMLIRKFCRWRQFDNVFRLWNEMGESGLGPDRSAYTVLIHGLFLNSKLEEAYKYYIEMKGKNLLPDPKMEEILQSWVSGKQASENRIVGIEGNNSTVSEPHIVSKKFQRQTNFQQPETRRIFREGGFSSLE